MNDAPTAGDPIEVPQIAAEDLPPPDEELIWDDGEPMETYWHRCAMNLLIEVVYWHNRDRTDFYVGGNMFIYYSARQARTREYRGPDFFFVWRVNRFPMRKFWAVWNEGGKYPDLIIELLSPTTAELDLTVKKDLYRTVFQTRDYFCYDPDSQSLRGWRLREGEYEPLTPNKEGRLWCQELGLWLGPWKGSYLGYEDVWLRFFDAEGRLVPTPAEWQHELAEAEQKRAEEAQRRLAAAEAEVARLNKKLREGEKRTQGTDDAPGTVSQVG
jgi:Uma2 family endonuclease